MAPIRIVIRSLAGESNEIDIEASASIAELKKAIQVSTKIPIVEQRLVFAGTQLEEVATEAWRRRRSGNEGSALSAALGVESIPDGAPLTLEHYAIQKGSVVNIVRRIASSAPVETHDEPGHQPEDNIPAAAPSRFPEHAPESAFAAACRAVPDATPAGEDSDRTAQSQRARAEAVSLRVSGQHRNAARALEPAATQPPTPVLEFVEPEPRQQQPASGRGQPFGHGGYAGQITSMNGHGRDSGQARDSGKVAQELASRLDTLDDVALYALLNPLLHKRPQLRASLLQAPSPATTATDQRASASATSAVAASAAAAEAARQAAASRFSERGSEQQFRRNDLVYVFSNSAQRWCEGTVLQVSNQSNGKIPQGAVEVSFELGQKWIAPQDAPKILRARV